MRRLEEFYVGPGPYITSQTKSFYRNLRLLLNKRFLGGIQDLYSLDSSAQWFTQHGVFLQFEPLTIDPILQANASGIALLRATRIHVPLLITVI